MAEPGGVGAEVRVDRDGAVAWLRYASELDRLDADGLARIRAALDALTADAGVRVIVFGGLPGRFPTLMDPEQGLEIAAYAPPSVVPRGFVAWVVGWTVAALVAVPALRRVLDVRALALRVALLNARVACALLERCDKVTVAAIDGPAFGGGMELALACDLRVASDRADVWLAQPEAVGGVMAGFGATQRLPRLIGHARAAELLLVTDPIRPDEALRWGLVNRVWPDGAFADETWAFARRLAKRSAPAVAGTKRALLEASGGLDPGLDAELREVVQVWRSDAAHHGLRGVGAHIARERAKAEAGEPHTPLPELLAAVERDQ